MIRGKFDLWIRFTLAFWEVLIDTLTSGERFLESIMEDFLLKG